MVANSGGPAAGGAEQQGLREQHQRAREAPAARAAAGDY